MDEIDEIMNEMFGGEESPPQANEGLCALAESIADLDYEVSNLKNELGQKDKKLKKLKEELCLKMIEAGVDKLQFNNGLSPGRVVKPKFFKQAGIEDTQLHDFLRERGLGDIIKPYVHFNTLQATLKAEVEAGRELPENLINQTEEYSVRLNGKSNYLKNKVEKEN